MLSFKTIDTENAFVVNRAVRIQNMPLWRDYAHRREAMVAKYGDALAHSDANEWLSTRPILTATNQVVGLLERRANEYFLFHGTNLQTADTLKQTGKTTTYAVLSTIVIWRALRTLTSRD